MKLLPSAPGYLNRNAEIPTIADYLDLSVLLFFFTPPRYLHQNACHPPGNNMQILAVRERFVPGKLDLALFECAICKCRTMENLRGEMVVPKFLDSAMQFTFDITIMEK